MSDVTETGVETAQNGDAEMADLMAGYNARSGNPLPAEVPNTSSEQPVGEAPANEVPNDTQDEEVVDPVVEQQKDAAQLLEERLAAFKDEVRAMASSGDPAAVRKLHGEIGDINRKLKQLEPKPAPEPAPVDEELTAAMQGAERVGEEFQELGGPLVTALKAVHKAATKPAPQGMTTEEVNERIQSEAKRIADEESQRRYDQAVTVLQSDHPDFTTVIASPEFDAWVKTKPAAMQEVIRETDDPTLAGRYLTEFKETQRVQQQKQNRLANAVAPKGSPAAPAKSKLTDEEQLWDGYNTRAKRRSF